MQYLDTFFSQKMRWKLYFISNSLNRKSNGYKIKEFGGTFIALLMYKIVY